MIKRDVVWARIQAAREIARRYPSFVEKFDREILRRASASDDRRWCDCKPTDPDIR